MSGRTLHGLFVSDIDGTLVTPDKQLTAASSEAVAELRAAGVPFTVVSSRPPRGMAKVIDALDLTLPAAAFNGGVVFEPGGKVLIAHRLTEAAARTALAAIARGGADAWVFANDAWHIADPAGSNIDRERRTVGFEPTVVADFDDAIGRVDKIVAVSNDYPRLDAVEADLRTALGANATIERSQPYYVDVTHSLANKGEAVRALAGILGVDLARMVVIGDMTNDIAMFRVAGFSIAMGQGPPAVKAAATAVTHANTKDGFAEAVRQFVLPRLGQVGETTRA
jgi:hypothetical protein